LLRPAAIPLPASAAPKLGNDVPAKKMTTRPTMKMSKFNPMPTVPNPLKMNIAAMMPKRVMMVQAEYSVHLTVQCFSRSPRALLRFISMLVISFHLVLLAEHYPADESVE
jgi:hypothetical protein